MNAAVLFHRIEQDIPLSLAISGDKNGYIGMEDPNQLDVQKILVLMDYIPSEKEKIDYMQYDLLILHHPPLLDPIIPAYIIHSNWDVLRGEACNALADALHMLPLEILDETTGIGRIGKLSEENVTQGRFLHEIIATLKTRDIRMVNYNKFQIVDTVCVISGFGLSSDNIVKAVQKGVDVVVSGDLTYQSALIARNTGITLIDATHYATELPGLYRLGERLRSLGLEVCVRNIGQPWVGV